MIASYPLWAQTCAIAMRSRVLSQALKSPVSICEIGRGGVGHRMQLLSLDECLTESPGIPRLGQDPVAD